MIPNSLVRGGSSLDSMADRGESQAVPALPANLEDLPTLREALRKMNEK